MSVEVGVSIRPSPFQFPRRMLTGDGRTSIAQPPRYARWRIRTATRRLATTRRHALRCCKPFILHQRSHETSRVCCGADWVDRLWLRVARKKQSIHIAGRAAVRKVGNSDRVPLFGVSLPPLVASAHAHGGGTAQGRFCARLTATWAHGPCSKYRHAAAIQGLRSAFGEHRARLPLHADTPIAGWPASRRTAKPASCPSFPAPGRSPQMPGDPRTRS